MNWHITRSTLPFFAGGPPSRQRGISIVLITIALVALLGMSGLALDGGHLMLNKTRLQNTVDAAALSAAKIVDQTSGDTDAGRQAALDTFADNTAGAGNEELADAAIDVVVQFSETLNPFTPGSLDGPFVRVIATDFRLPIFLWMIVGADDKRVAASAVAGPSPTLMPPDEACNIAPLSMCGDPNLPGYGLQPGSLQALKLAAGSNDGADSPNACEIGPGNFQLIRLGGEPGANTVRNNLAGGYDGCLTLDTEVETQPGNMTAVAQGLNTRFGVYAGPMGDNQGDYPPDVVVTESDLYAFEDEDDCTTICQGSPNCEADPSTYVDHEEDLVGDYNYAQYQSDVTSGNFDYPPAPDGTGAYERRVLVVPIIDCTGPAQGQSTIPLLGYGCFFLLQTMDQGGNVAHIFGETIGQCSAGGTPGPNPPPEPGTGPEVTVIQLYKDPDSTDS